MKLEHPGPLVTCIVPTHNRPHLLSKALESIQAQTYGPLEVLVVDDSEEIYVLANKKILDTYGYIYLQNHEQPGACGSRNLGLDHATGEFVAFLDDDDQWHPEKIAAQVAAMLHTQADLCATSTIYHYKKRFGTTITTHSGTQTGYSPINLHHMAGSNILGSTSSYMVTRSIAHRFRFDTTMLALQDYDFAFRILLAGNLTILLHQPLTTILVHRGQRITTNHGRKLSGLRRFFLRYSTHFTDQERKAFLWKIMLHHYLTYGGGIPTLIRMYQLRPNLPRLKTLTILFRHVLRRLKHIHTKT